MYKFKGVVMEIRPPQTWVNTPGNPPRQIQVLTKGRVGIDLEVGCPRAMESHLFLGPTAVQELESVLPLSNTVPLEL